MKEFLYLGFTIPNKEMKKIFKDDEFPAIQTHKFSWNLLKGLEENKLEDMNINYISFRPVSDYPYYNKKKILKNKWEININKKSIILHEVPYINTSILKIISRFIYGLFYSLKIFHNKKNKEAVIGYSVHIPIMAISYLLSRIYKIKYIAIWTDPPSVHNNRESFLKSKLRKIEYKLSLFFMKRADKIIALTKYLAEDFAPQKPYLVVEGFVDTDEIESKDSEKKESKIITILYTGSLEKRYGIKNIVKGVQLLKEKNIRLEIYGRGDYENELKKICIKDSRIKYKGFISNELILEKQKHADFLINARPLEEDYVKYSFPSKMLEYMISGTPVITTVLPGMPEEYREYVFVLKDNNSITIKNKIEELMYKTTFEKEEFGKKAQRFVINKSYKEQGQRIVNFILESRF